MTIGRHSHTATPFHTLAVLEEMVLSAQSVAMAVILYGAASARSSRISDIALDLSMPIRER
jgi:hypothetical protein